MNLTAITFLIQSMIYSACIKRDGLFRWTTYMLETGIEKVLN